MGYFDRLFSAWAGKSQLRIAVTGTTSSGKSYLLRDLITALEQHCAIGNGKRSNPLFNTILQLKSQLMDIEKTAMFPMRQYDIYADHVTIGGKTVEVLLADIPGECFTPDNLTMFKSIYEALLECKSKIFGLRRWQRDDKQRYTVFVKGGAYTPAGDMITDSNQYAASSRNRYIDNANLISNLQRSGCKADNDELMVNGEQLLERFWQLEIDTLINAIDAAWDLLDINAYLIKYHSDLDRKTFTDTNARLAFTPLLYAITATDIVISDMMASPGKQLSDAALGRAMAANADFMAMVQTLQQLKNITDSANNAKNWYLALKGVDSILDAKNMAGVYNAGNKDSNFTYSWMTLAFARAFLHNEVHFDSDLEFHLTLSQGVSLVDRRHDDDGNEIEVPRLRRNYPHSRNYFAQQGSYTVMAYSKPADGSHARPLQLKQYVELRDRYFRSLTGYQSSGESCAAIGMAPHTFLVAHPIDVDFNIYGKRDDTHFTDDWTLATPLAFGTTQLLTDILLQHGIDPGVDYGNLLSYFFGNK